MSTPSTACPWALRRTFTVKFWPTVTDWELGERERVAAEARAGNKKRMEACNMACLYFIILF